jgi:hypothetical protein
MSKPDEKTSNEKQNSYKRHTHKVIFKKIIWYTLGIIAAALWITLFIAGLTVDSSYYLKAVCYHFSEISDWIGLIFSFTLSNVPILAILSGFLGGICSLVIETRGFTINSDEEKKKDYILIESPVISALRGLLVFVAILSLQYLSSFNDLGSVSKTVEQIQKEQEIPNEAMYVKLTEIMKDSAELHKIRSWMDKQKTEIDTNNFKILKQIFLLKYSSTDRLNSIGNMGPSNNKLQIRMLRMRLTIPANVNYSWMGFTALSYFKFAIIVSFLSFIFGYHPDKFSDWIGRFFKDKVKNDSDNSKNILPDKL